MTHTVKNIAPGPRGFRDVASGYVELDPGAIATDVTFAPGELESARETGYFEISGGDALAPVELPEKRDDLDALALSLGIDLATIVGTGANGNVVKSDVVAAIEAKRAEGAGGGDALDGMSDDELRAAVAAITGSEVPADADRSALLALARGV